MHVVITSFFAGPTAGAPQQATHSSHCHDGMVVCAQAGEVLVWDNRRMMHRAATGDSFSCFAVSPGHPLLSLFLLYILGLLPFLQSLHAFFLIYSLCVPSSSLSPTIFCLPPSFTSLLYCVSLSPFLHSSIHRHALISLPLRLPGDADGGFNEAAGRQQLQAVLPISCATRPNWHDGGRIRRGHQQNYRLRRRWLPLAGTSG